MQQQNKKIENSVTIEFLFGEAMRIAEERRRGEKISSSRLEVETLKRCMLENKTHLI
jgi:hypothetical protein